MEKDNKSGYLIEKLYGGLKMSWPAVILFAVGAAVLTSAFLIVPVFQDTSFARMGVYLEAWFFFAIIIMANCKKPLESALKTFVFFLISQPLIYLIQVPFSVFGWSIFGFYNTWFIWTLLTLPMAYIGWYITKKNWLSLLILAPVLAFMGLTAYQSGTHCIHHFPYLLITCLFCLLQIILYLTTFLPGKKRLVGIAIPILTAVILALTTSKVDMNVAVFLPDDPILTDSAYIIMDDDPSVNITIERTGEDSMVRVLAKRFGGVDFSIQDGETEYRYSAVIYEDDAGHSQIRITERLLE